ncbi:MAG: Gfo/Idh/MocA family oxidoreductase [Clostridia bacterium]|nr:Gfo/Idh/MocA family oxidoreductase [Clostridia bacterium]
MLNVGFIGFGSRASGFWKRNLAPFGLCTVKAIADPRLEEIKAVWGEELPDCTWYTNAEEMMEKEKLDGVFVGTRCNLHTKYALLVAKYDIPLFLEKPVSITDEEIAQLESIPHMDKKTVVSFPLRVAQLVTVVKDIIDRGVIGEVAQVQAYNNVNYARIYYHGWYRDTDITGGLFLQKSTHDLDYINYVLGRTGPKTICAMESKLVFKGDKPAGVKCADCPEYLTCTESSYNIEKYDPKRVIADAKCCYATDTGNHDSATVLMQYDDGLCVTYTQNFIARKGAGKRGARFIGYKGTVEFDFNAKTVTYYDHMSDRVDHISIQSTGSHSGGDLNLAQNFIDVMSGKDVSHSPLSQGILSAKMCLAARKSARTHTFVEL